MKYILIIFIMASCITKEAKTERANRYKAADVEKINLLTIEGDTVVLEKSPLDGKLSIYEIKQR